MGGLSIWHWLVVAIVVMLFFGGRGKVSELMGDFAKGIKAFKKGMADDEEKPQPQAVPPITANEPVRTLPPHPAEPVHAAPQGAGAAPDRKVG